MAPTRRGGKYERDTGYRATPAITRSLFTPYGRRSTRSSSQSAEASTLRPDLGEAVQRSNRVALRQETESYSRVDNDIKSKSRSKTTTKIRMKSSQDSKQKQKEDEEEDFKMRRKPILLLPATNNKRPLMDLEKYRYEGSPPTRPVITTGTNTCTSSLSTMPHTDTIKGEEKEEEVDETSERSSSPLSSLPESDPPSPVVSPITSRGQSLPRREGEADQWRPSLMNQRYGDLPTQAGKYEREENEKGSMVIENRTITLPAAEPPLQAPSSVGNRVEEVAEQQADPLLQSAPTEQSRNDLLFVPHKQSVSRFAPPGPATQSHQEHRPIAQDTVRSATHTTQSAQQSYVPGDQDTLHSSQRELKAPLRDHRPQPLPSALVMKKWKSPNPQVSSKEPQRLTLLTANKGEDTVSAHRVFEHEHEQRSVTNAPFKPSPLNPGWTTMSSDSDPGNRSATPTSEATMKVQKEVKVPEQKQQAKIFKTPFFPYKPLQVNPKVTFPDTARAEALPVKRQRPMFVRAPRKRDSIPSDKQFNTSKATIDVSATLTHSGTSLEAPRVTIDMPPIGDLNAEERSSSTLADELPSLKRYAECLTNIVQQAASWQGVDGRGANDVHQVVATSSSLQTDSQPQHEVQCQGVQDQVRFQLSEVEQEDRWRSAIDIWAEAPRLPTLLQFPTSYERTRISLSPDEEENDFPPPLPLPPAPAPVPVQGVTMIIPLRVSETRRNSF